MGAPDGEANSSANERPVHAVSFAEGFFMAKYELTEAVYQACEDAGACAGLAQTGDARPQAEINWDEAKAACAWLGGRLPSEAEWEYAASGPEHQLYPWGAAEANCNLAVMDNGADGCGEGRMWDVGSKAGGASYIGAMDMGGNVWEWVEDCWHESYASAPANGEAWTGGCSSTSRVFRGGSFDGTASVLRSAGRNYGTPLTRYIDLGVRCLLWSP